MYLYDVKISPKEAAMAIFLILAPYGAYALMMLMTSAVVSLFAATAVCLGVIAFDIVRGRSIKILTVGSVMVFAAVGGYVALVDPAMSTSAVKFAVDAGIFLLSLLSIVLRHPFTLQYAREVVDAETALLPGFVRANYLLTWIWTGAALLMMIGNIALLYVPGLPIWSGLLVTFAARNCAVYFTKWYPQYRKAKYGSVPVNALPGTR